ncbi:hypothetical protein [Sodaliphilus pleomorphus]|nr:hypothetical protein [Sodaliphilus pleomorphus]MDD6687328.1 hypothetical protein [Sodaliphilus pleomorphus]
MKSCGLGAWVLGWSVSMSQDSTVCLPASKLTPTFTCCCCLYCKRNQNN